jgi:hypothetical protein
MILDLTAGFQVVGPVWLDWLVFFDDRLERNEELRSRAAGSKGSRLYGARGTLAEREDPDDFRETTIGIFCQPHHALKNV